MDMIHLLLLLGIIFYLSYWFLTRNFNYWKKQCVPSAANPVPGFGHMAKVIFLKENVSDLVNRIYKETEASMIGFYFVQKPGIIVRDPELVKSVLQTNFSSFHNNILKISEKADPVMSRNPFFTDDHDLWKAARGRTTAHLTGRKMTSLFAINQQVCSKLCDFTARKIGENRGTYECQLKKFFIKCTGEIVANSAFAIEGQSFQDNPDKLSFSNVAQFIFEPNFINGIKQALLFYLPSLANFFQIPFLEKKAEEYFRTTAQEIIRHRKQAKIAPNDYLQFVIGSNGEDINGIVADLIIFYGDVYETGSTVMAVAFYYLSKNKEIQDKLRQHILEVLKSSGGQITYDSLKNMNYLDQVMKESMRMNLPLGVLMKVCTEPITLEGSDGLKCHLKPGDPVFIPAMALAQDGHYWPNPETFDPERFAPDGQDEHNKYTFLAFGEGPRMCVGMRFGVMMVKQVIASMLIKYSVEYSSKTKEPLEMEPTSFLTHIKGGLWAKFKKLDQNN